MLQCFVAMLSEIPATIISWERYELDDTHQFQGIENVSQEVSGLFSLSHSQSVYCTCLQVLKFYVLMLAVG